MTIKSKTTGKRILLSINLLILIAFSGFSQSQGYNHQFIRHLINLRAYDEGLFAVDMMLKSATDREEIDSLRYLQGKLYYYKVDQPSSIAALGQVSTMSPFTTESRLLGGYQQFFLGEYEDGLQTIRNFKPASGLEKQVVNFEEAGVSLLKRDLESFSNLETNFNDQYWQLTESQKKLIEVEESIRKHKKKSPFMAAALSAIIPGSGRMYYGKIGQGIIVLFAHSIFAVQSIEGYQKDGPKSARFIIFTSLFSGFYVANIWGSALGVKIRRDEFNEQTNHTLLVTMHVPLRFLYD